MSQYLNVRNLNPAASTTFVRVSAYARKGEVFNSIGIRSLTGVGFCVILSDGFTRALILRIAQLPLRPLVFTDSMDSECRSSCYLY